MLSNQFSLKQTLASFFERFDIVEGARDMIEALSQLKKALTDWVNSDKNHRPRDSAQIHDGMLKMWHRANRGIFFFRQIDNCAAKSGAMRFISPAMDNI